MHHLALGITGLLLAGVCLAAAALAGLRAVAGAVATAALFSTMPAAAGEPADDFWYGTHAFACRGRDPSSRNRPADRSLVRGAAGLCRGGRIRFAAPC